jgi:hypothetical protein
VEPDRYEAQARIEAWDRALKILKPWVDSTKHTGSKELRHVMTVALDTAMREYNSALEKSREMDRSAS